MAYSQNFPAQRPVFQFNADAGRVSPNMTFSRSDSPIDATKAAASAVHFWSNEKHLSSDNLFTHSSTFDNAAWLGTGIAKTGGQTDPAGGSNGYTFVEDTTGNYHNAYQNVSGNESWALTVYGKQNTGTRYLLLRLYGGSANNFETAVFDLAGSAPSTASGSSSGFTNVSATQTASGNGFYKCTLKGTGSITFGALHISQNSTATGLDAYGYAAYTGDNTSSIDVAFASLSTTGATDYNATTTQIHREYAPTLKSVATAGQPRFEYDPTDGQSMGILVESQFQELLTYTEDLTNAAFTKSNLTIGSNAAISPDGTLTADLCTESDDSSGQDHSLVVTSPTLSAATHTLSVFAKSAGRSHVQLQAYMGSIALNCQAMFSLTDGSVSGLTNATGSTESLGNGWYRLKMHFTPTGSAVAGLYFRLCSDASTNNYTGNGYSGAIMWGANLTQSSHAYSYLKADAAATTKAADSMSADLSDIGYTGGPVTGIVDAVNIGTANYPTFVTVVDATGNQRVMVQGNSTSSNVDTYVLTDGTQVANPSSTLNTTASKVGFRSDTNNFATVVNGGTVSTDTSGSIPASASTLHIGQNHNSQYQVNGNIKRVAIYSEALSDQNLISLTS
tara:strand:+ start:3367 stop:5220 length:1854 start_codon:yes stop_codon:yes gene_type:complete